MNLQSVDALRGRIMAALAALSVWSDRHWKWLTFVAWVGIVAFFLVTRWPTIQWMVLSDTDDNIRYVQVRDWLAGQGWYDLRQYRLDPPGGANIHWSRIVDLPLAALMLFFRAFVDQGMADRLACGIAPLIPLLLLMGSLAFIARRLSGGHGWIIAMLLPLAAGMGMSMYMPMRVDHHGWQLALALTMVAGLVDRDWLRGGVVAGVSSALSLAIGMEMIVYLAAGGAVIALRWVFKEGAARRMLPYAISLSGSTALLFVLFASYANREMVCDALSPIWVAIFAAVGAGMTVLALLPIKGWPMRLAAGAVVGGMVVAFAWLNWPQCLSGAYQISPELQRLWLANIREAKPLTVQSQSLVVPLLALPTLGLFGIIGGLWATRRDPDRMWAIGSTGLMMVFAAALLFWQLRAGPAAQLLAIPAAAYALHGVVRAVIHGRKLARAAGLVAGAAGLAVLCAYPLYPHAMALWNKWTGAVPTPVKPVVQARRDAIKRANARCRTQPALAVLDELPPATIFTVVDLGPRIIATTHHSAIAGPYHRNGPAILDIHHAFDGPPDAFRAIARRHGATLLLLCPNFPEGTLYQQRSVHGFYAQLMRGNIPAWLKPVTFRSPLTLPYQVYRIDYSAPGGEKVAQQR